MRSPTRYPMLPGLSVLQEQMNRLFEDLHGGYAPEESSTREWTPLADAYETDDALVLAIDLPGIEPDGVELTVTGESLAIAGERAAAASGKDVRWYRFERPTGAFRRRIPLPFAVDAEKAEAEFRHGQLIVTLPKSVEGMPKRIKPKAA